MRIKNKKENFIIFVILFLLTLGLAAGLVFGLGNFEELAGEPLGVIIAFCIVFGGVLLACIYCAIASLVEYIDFCDSQVYEHRFLLKDRSFSLDDVTGMRPIVGRYRLVRLYIDGKKCFEMTYGYHDSDALWTSIKGRNYPPQLYKGETPEHFAVKPHGDSYGFLGMILIGLIALLVLMAPPEEWPAVALFILIFVPLGLIVIAAGTQVYVDGDMLRSRRLFKYRSAHVRELKYVSGTVSGKPQLRYRDDGKLFARLGDMSADNLYAMRLYLEARGIRCSDLAGMK